MTHDAPVSKMVTIKNGWGLHFRPARKFVDLAGGFVSDVKVMCKGGEFNGKSILDLTGLGADKGTPLEIAACGPDAEVAVATLVALVEAGFYEDDNGQEQDPAP